MKTLLLPIIVAAGTLIPVSHLNAETFGGFETGKKFTLTVTDRTSTKTKGDNVTKNAPIPDGIPDFAEGQKVRFRIGAKGNLVGGEFNINFRRETGDVVIYSNNPTFSKPHGDAATVTKNSNGKPVAATLTFYRFRFSGFIPVTNTVNYVFER
ncbi:MAG: hypothetical protein ABIT37_22060 [Luteolibacter sp.]